MKVYTKTGDKGETGLVGGKRVSKADHRIDLYGEVDELNSRIGVSVSFLTKTLGQSKELEFLHTLQSALFDLGSNLACEAAEREKYSLPQISQKLIDDMEAEIDRMQEGLAPLKSFILPGGTHDTAFLHLCRTGARNVERKLIAFVSETQEEAPQLACEFINRLSDYFFVFARYVTKIEGGSEILWKGRS